MNVLDALGVPVENVSRRPSEGMIEGVELSQMPTEDVSKEESISS